jgi:hypothetical protein
LALDEPLGNAAVPYCLGDLRTLVEEGVQGKYIMVNTFLPYADEIKTARALDDKRLGKQRVESLQILKANLGMTLGWRNHPAAVMWRGHEGLLCVYNLRICEEWKDRGYQDTVSTQTQDIMNTLGPTAFRRPWWWGNIDFHRSHQSNLNRKDPHHYNFDVPDDLPYLWPKEQGILLTKEESNAIKAQLLIQARKKSREERSLAGNS